jgi:hypothetical protein
MYVNRERYGDVCSCDKTEYFKERLTGAKYTKCTIYISESIKIVYSFFGIQRYVI